MTGQKILFLPGAGGSPDFWRPVADRLPVDCAKERFAWPGLGNQPHDAAIRGIDDLVQLILARMDGPVDLIAQSMGGVVAVRLALERPDLVRRLVLCATSGGVDMDGLGAGDWRPAYLKSFPDAAAWITAPRASPFLPIEKVVAPTLLIWGDRDAISPISVGRHLAERLGTARLEVVAGGDHDLAVAHADIVAEMIRKWLFAPPA